ncbi:hypothetical protein PoB_006066200 [Plakobranchus ocellatus]|uniref:Uncharacterized protein n=1 Tax=Plakobranchus ocellatus TaxID=259542 RepID=A0AAV4CQK1_9GAST|nr:hypothetical protein PoB_006066200 [Plakobranchus ocellatus]
MSKNYQYTRPVRRTVNAFKYLRKLNDTKRVSSPKPVFNQHHISTLRPVLNKVISGQGAGGGARTRDRRVPADLRVDSLTPTPPENEEEERWNN